MPNPPPSPYLLNNDESYLRNRLGRGQDYLVWCDASAAQGNNPAGLNNGAPQATFIAGQKLKDLAAHITAGYYTALAAGTYYAQFVMAAMAKPTVDLKATFSGGTVTTAAWSTQMDQQTQRQAFTGTGALTSGTTQNPSLSSPAGEAIAVVQIVVGAGGSVTAFPLAERLSMAG